MARQSQEKIYANFSGGFVTEGNILSYPENAASEFFNFDLKQNGSISRRLGLTVESTVPVSLPASESVNPAASNIFKWSNVNGDPDLSIMVVQVGRRLDFFTLLEEDITSQVAAPSVFLTPSFGSVLSNVYDNDLSAASGAGVIFIAGRHIDPSYLKYDEFAGTVSVTPIDIEIRDFKVWKEGEFTGDISLAGEVRQSSMSGYHQYNLFNQGWPDVRDAEPFNDVGEAFAQVAVDDEPSHGSVQLKPALDTFNTLGFFPTTADAFHTYQTGGGTSIRTQTSYQPFNLINAYQGNTKAGRGHSILKAFNRIREGKSNTNLLASETELTLSRPESVAFYAGRVWYAGTRGDGFSSEVYFSQILENKLERAGKCLQEADPTAEIINELVATDGGVLSIEEMGQVYSMQQFGTSLVFMTSQGVWSVSGEGEDSSFTATGFSIRKVSDKESVSNNAIVKAKDSLLYLGKSAIYALSQNELGILQAQDISSGKIKTFFQALSTAQKTFGFSVYDEGNDRVYWYYPSEVDILTNPIPIVDKALFLDLPLQAFGKYELSTGSASLLRGGLSVDINTVISSSNNMQIAGVDMVINGVQVAEDNNQTIPDRSSVKLFTQVASDYVFADFRVESFTDFGTSYNSELETGFDSLGDVMRAAKKGPRAVFHMERDGDSVAGVYDNNSGALVSYSWDWVDSVYGNVFQAYRVPTATEDQGSVSTSKTRLKGKGTSLGFKIESELGKPLNLLGYGILFTSRDTI